MKTTKKLLAVLIAMVLICSFAFSAGAAEAAIKDTKTYSFLKTLKDTRTITASIDDISEGPITVSGIKAVAKINENSIDLKAKAKVSLSSLSANALYENGKLMAYAAIFKVDVTDLLQDYFDINEILSEIDVEELNDVIDMADDDVITALKIDSKTDTVEKFSVSPVLYLANVAGCSEEDLFKALQAGGSTVTADSTDAEIKEAVTAAAKSGVLAKALVLLGKYSTEAEAQEEMDTLVRYMNSSYEFDYDGNYITNIIITGDTNFNLKENLGSFSAKISAGDQGLGYSAPSFAIDITSFAKSIIKIVLNIIGA